MNNLEKNREWPEMEICKQYAFSAGHYLPHVGANHPCRRQHGHNYNVEVIVRGTRNPNTGMVVDFKEIDKIIVPLVEIVDHQNLNDLGIPLLDNPTAENIALWFLREAEVKIIYAVRVWETPKCYAEAINHDGLYTGNKRRG